MAKMRVDQLSRAGFTNVAFLWHQGEIDRIDQGGNAADYRIRLRQVIGLTKSIYPKSAFFVSVATKCGIETDPDPEIQQAQLSAISPSEGVYAGPNTDLLNNDFRSDGCHFNAKGAKAEVSLWLDSLRASNLLSTDQSFSYH
jgi:lysophospholipase L1-like esterase